MLGKTGVVLLVSLLALTAAAQDTLPKFTLISRGTDRVIVSWSNPYGTAIKQLSIQRSFDSLKNFATILSVPDPTVLQNGYVDSKFPSNRMFYRLYIQLDSGKYLFSKSKRPAPDTAKAQVKPAETRSPDPPRIQEEPKRTEPPVVTSDPKPAEKRPEEQVAEKIPVKPKEVPERIIFIKKRDTLIAQYGERYIKRFKDSIAFRTKDTLTYATADTIVIRPFVPKEVYKPSRYVFTQPDGNVRIALPDADTRKYVIRFFEANASPLFEIKQVKDTLLILDKTNFIHSGWYRFEIYEDGQLKEKHRLFIPKDF